MTELIHITPDCEKLIAYCARVSSPNPENPDFAGLLSYCIKNSHWSVFEMGSMCVEITTSRAIAQQILRHRSFHFQEFSQRYAAATSVQVYEARRQDTKNRQNSIDDMSEEDRVWFYNAQIEHSGKSLELYEEAIKRGVAKEQARFLLPLATTTKLYMHGTIRDWIHYLNLRASNGTQKEHSDIAKEIQEIFLDNLPIIGKALNWRT